MAIASPGSGARRDLPITRAPISLLIEGDLKVRFYDYRDRHYCTFFSTEAGQKLSLRGRLAVDNEPDARHESGIDHRSALLPTLAGPDERHRNHYVAF